MSREDQAHDLLPMPSTTHSLIEENEELTARLVANARKTSELERKLQESEFSRSEQERRIETLSEQILIYREKDRLQRERLEKNEKKLKQLFSERELHEIRYAELFSTSQSNLRKSEETKKTLLKKIKHLYRFNCWVRDSLFPAHRRQREDLTALRNSLSETQRQLLEARDSLRTAKDATEAESRRLKNDNLNLEKELAELRQKQNETEQKYLLLKDEQTLQQNRVIAAERIRDEIQDKYKRETAEWRSRLSEFQDESRHLKLETRELREQLLNLENEHKKSIRQNEKLRDQNESIQELWGDNRRQLEKLTARESALQKLNQELSQQLKEARQSGTELKKELIEARKNAEQNLHRLKTELTLMESEKTPLGQASVPKETMEKIEGLLAEIQTGYSRPVISSRLPDHHFIERDELLSEEGLLRL